MLFCFFCVYLQMIRHISNQDIVEKKRSVMLICELKT